MAANQKRFTEVMIGVGQAVVPLQFFLDRLKDEGLVDEMKKAFEDVGVFEPTITRDHVEAILLVDAIRGFVEGCPEKNKDKKRRVP